MMASFHQVLKTLVVFLIPAYFTLAAVTTTTQEDDQAWLRYWVVISIFSLVELPMDNLNFLPCYNCVKLIFVLWCLLPGLFSGSNIIFQMVRI
jgi:receptor expression-enhancing protein 5/6